MEIYTLSIPLDLTHVGKSNTRDNYLLVNQPLLQKDKFTRPLFDNQDIEVLEIRDLISGEIYSVKAAYKHKANYSSEYRITKMASYISNHGLDSGDIIHFQRIKYSETESQYYIWYTKFDGIVLHQEGNGVYRPNSDSKLQHLLLEQVFLQIEENIHEVSFNQVGALTLTKPHRDNPFPLYEVNLADDAYVFSAKEIHLKNVKPNILQIVEIPDKKFTEIKESD